MQPSKNTAEKLIIGTSPGKNGRKCHHPSECPEQRRLSYNGSLYIKENQPTINAQTGDCNRNPKILHSIWSLRHSYLNLKPYLN